MTFPVVNQLAPQQRRLDQAHEALAQIGRDLVARDGNQRFPDSEQAPERAASMVHSLTALGRASEGRAVAEDMVNRYPDSVWVRQIEQYTGAHRHRSVRTNAAGQLEFY